MTLRQVAQYADACNFFQVDPFGEGLLTPSTVRDKLSILRRHCADLGRPYDSVLPTYATGWTILARDEESLRSKLAHYFPGGVEQRYSGTWRHFVHAATPERAVADFRTIRDAGIQYVIVQTLDASDEETITLLAQEVVPRVINTM